MTRMSHRAHAVIGFAVLSIPILLSLLERLRQREEPQKKQENPAASLATDKKKKKRSAAPGARTPVGKADDVAGCIELLRTAGLVRINSVLDRQTSNQYGHRHDVKLSLDSDEVRSALGAALAVLGPLLTAVLGEDSTLFELSAIAADAGTPAQALHFDFARPPDRPAVLVVFLALHDVAASQGPTFFAPGSHDADFRRAVESAWSPGDGNASARGKVREQQPLCRPLLSAGDCVVMDSALYHAGGANTTASDRRLLFHFSFARAGAHGLGQRTSSLLESLRGKHSLNELRTTEAR